MIDRAKYYGDYYNCKKWIYRERYLQKKWFFVYFSIIIDLFKLKTSRLTNETCLYSSLHILVFFFFTKFKT